MRLSAWLWVNQSREAPRVALIYVENSEALGSIEIIYLVQIDQLLLGTHGCALQHPLQLREGRACVSGDPDDPEDLGRAELKARMGLATELPCWMQPPRPAPHRPGGSEGRALVGEALVL